MRKLTLPTLAIILLTLAGSCNSDHGRPISDLGKMTQLDSMLYYYGLLRAHEYNQLAINDTNLRNIKNKERFLAGVQKGYDLLRDDDDAYNMGVRIGLRMAENTQRFESDYNMQVDDKCLFEALKYGIIDTDTINELSAQKNFYRLLHKLNAVRDDNVRTNALKALAVEAKKLDMKEVTPCLFKKVLEEGTDERVDSGATILVDVDYTQTNGENLGMPNPEEIVVGGRAMPMAMLRAYTSMTKGETALFATTAGELFGTRSGLINLKPSDLILIRIDVTDIVSAVPLRGEPASDEEY